MRLFLLIISIASILQNIEAQSPAVFTVNGTQLISPEGEPIKLCGWRIDANAYETRREVSLSDFQRYDSQGLLGNAQGIEIWFSRGNLTSPSETYPWQPGIYRETSLNALLDVMRAIARSDSWIIPSIRVSYDQTVAIENTKKGLVTWQGWADHQKVIFNEPVVVEEGVHAGTYGNHGDRFFAWLDWIIPKILADPEISSHIAYWEIWHFYAHRHNATSYNPEYYLKTYIPKLIAKYREYEPDRLLGISVRNSGVLATLNRLIDEGNWTPWDDKNWILVYGGYGFHDMFFTDKNIVRSWPAQSINPLWITASKEFDLEKYIRLTGRAMHTQEGPGLREWYRTTPLPALQEEWLINLFNLYNEKTNGFAFHAWPPSQAYRPDKLPTFDETAFFNLARETLKGNKVYPLNIEKVNMQVDDPLKIYSFNNILKVEGIQQGKIIQIYSLTGSLLNKLSASSDTYETVLPKGIYIVRVENRKKNILIY